MAKKPTVTTLASGFNSTETLNANFEALRDGFDNTLSLDGSIPNAMGGDLDLNGNNILNATAILVGGSDVVATTAAALAAATQAQVDADAAVVASALSETNAANSATASQTSADASQASRLAAELAETNAETAETNAETAETNSETSATNSAASANAALGSQNAASSSAAAALASQVDANTSQGNASVSALAASNSETAAALSESNAATSETNAATSETNAATSETNAANSETAAAASETAAATSETNAATSETNAAASEATATTGANTATAQAIIATDQAAQAAADVASIQGAAGSAVEAANSAAAAAAALDNFDDRYLGPKTTEPTLDNDGDALVSGSLYFSTTSNAMQVYDGANWIAASASGVASMILYEYTATAGQTTFTGADDNSNSISFIQGNEIVVFNGIILDPSDYTSTSGVSIVLNVGASVGDLLNVYAFKSFTVADTVSASTGGTFGGDVTVTGTLAATTLTGDGSAITGLPAGYTNTDVATYLAGVGNVVVGGTVDGRDLAIDGAVIDGLSTVATSGSFNDLSDQPAPFDPTTLAPVATSGVYSDLTGTPTLAAVATSGAYSSLSGLPTLGTAASTASSAYATAAQGTKADTALQPALAGVTSVDAITVATFGAAGVGGGGTHDFVASGSIPNGALVGITLDGKAKVVSPLSAFDDYSGSSANFNKVVYDTNSNKVVVVYTRQNWTKAVVGTVNGTSITFGSEATVVNQISYNHSLTFDSNSNKVVVAFGNASLDTSSAYVGTVSGTSISFGSPSQFYNYSIINSALVFDSNSNKIVLGYRYGNNIYAKVGTVSGTSISFGGEVQVSQSNTRDLTTAAFDSSNNKVVFVYRNSSTDEGAARVGTVSGTSISFGTTTSFATNCFFPRVAFDSNVNKLFVSYGKSNDSYTGYAVVGTVSGTSISFGTPVQYMTAHDISEDTHDVTYDTVSQKPIIMYMQSNIWYVLVGTISGTSISFLPAVEGVFSYDTYMAITHNPDEDRLIIVGRSPQYGGAANVVDTTSVMSSFIGLADEAISDGSTGKVTIIGGVNASQSNLTTTATYYMDAAGDLTKTAAGSLGTVGIALSATEILKL